LVNDQEQPIRPRLLRQDLLHNVGECHLAAREQPRALLQGGNPGELVLARLGRQERRGELPQRVPPWPHHPDLPDPAVSAPAQLRHEAGQHHRALARAGGADDAQDRRPPDLLDHGLGERLAADEEGGVLLAEGLEPAIGADRRPRVRQARLGRLRRRLAAHRRGERLERAGVPGPTAEVDPGLQPQEAERRVLGAGQQHRDDREGVLARLAVERDILLAPLPWTEPVGAKADGDRAAGAELPLEELGPGLAGDEVVAVQEDAEPAPAELLGQALDRRGVGPAVAEEHIEARRLGHCVAPARTMVRRPAAAELGALPAGRPWPR
jgi:hypothetical protein